jgi:CheY-like chemotaxis protein
MKPYTSIVSYFGQDIRVLIVDDHPFNRDIIQDLFNRVDIYSDQASNGARAYNLLQKNQYDLLITDLRMPGMDGYELAEVAKKLSNPPIIYMCSADFFQIQRNTEKNHNIDRVLIKPITPQEIVDSIEKDFLLGWMYLYEEKYSEYIPQLSRKKNFPKDYQYTPLRNANYKPV